MHLTCIPRHRLELTASDYAALARDLLWPPDAAGSLREFESAFARQIGCRNAIAVPSGRMGLRLVLGRLKLSPGDEAILPAFNLHAVVEQFLSAGLTPRLCDVDARDLNIDAVAAGRLVTSRTRVLLATHMFGHSADLTALGELAARRDLILLEDCAHAFGTRWQGRCVGNFGRAAIFSFSVLKLVTTFGGGMIATNDDALAAEIREDLVWHTRPCSRGEAARRVLTGAALDGGTRKWPFTLGVWPALRLARHIVPEFQTRIMTEVPPTVSAAAEGVGARRRARHRRIPASLHPCFLKLGVRQLERADELIRRRREIGAALDQEWSGRAHASALQPRRGSEWNGLYYGLLCERPRELAEYLFAQGIDAETSEYRSCAELPRYREFAGDCSVARTVERRILRIPNHPGLSAADVRRIGMRVRGFYARFQPPGVFVTDERSAASHEVTTRAFARSRSETSPSVARSSAPVGD